MTAKHAPKPAIKAVLLDAAGTLIAPAEPVGKTYSDTARRFRINVQPEVLMQGFRDIFQEMPAMAFPGAPASDLKALERDWWRQLVRRVFDRAGVDVPEFEAFFDELFAHYGQAGAWQTFPEVLSVLRTLHRRGYVAVVVSNFDSRLPVLLEELGISPYLDGIVFSTAAGFEKPDTRIFSQALRIAGVTADRAVHVGDSEKADYAGARAAGMAALLLNRCSSLDGIAAPDQISGLNELLTWLRVRP